MASIKGFTLQNIKPICGTDYQGFTAEMYLNGKKVGTYIDSGNGDSGRAEYVSQEAEEKMMKVVIAYAKEHPHPMIVNLYKGHPEQFKAECERFKKYHPYIPEEDITVETMSGNSVEFIASDVRKLINVESFFERSLKRGYQAVALVGSNLAAYPTDWSREEIIEDAGGARVYWSLDDFVL